MTTIAQVAQQPINYGVRRQETKPRRSGYKAAASKTMQVKPADEDRRKALEAMRLRTQMQSRQASTMGSTAGMAQMGMAGLAGVAALTLNKGQLKKLVASGQSGNPGKPGSLRNAVFSSGSFKELLGNLTDVGFRAAETGVAGYPGVGPGHAPGGRHYAAPKKTVDLNFGAGGASALEARKMAKLYQLMIAAGVPINQYYHPGNDPAGHGDHGHLSVERKRW